MNDYVFLEKIRGPEPRGLVRGRLESRLTSGDGPSLALVLGPAGTGKTTLLSRVVAGAATSAWFRASSDDSEAALLRHLAHALGVVEPGAHRDDSPTVGSLVAALAHLGDRPVQLVVDDVHELSGSAAGRALERFLALRPRNIRVLLASRRPPTMNTSRLLVSEDLCQLDGEDLRFRSWEVEELFRTVYHRPLSPETAAALTRRTGGWAAGLRLFHLGTEDMSRVERERAVAGLSGRSLLIRSYLARNVLDGLDDGRRLFLLRTCTLGVLTGELCDALLDQSGSNAVLRELEEHQFFTTSTDGGLTYRYHQVLQTHLEVVLVDELGGPAARELYSRSARVLEQAGLLAAAVRAQARAEDWGEVARLVQHNNASLPATDEPLWGSLGLHGVPVDEPGLLLAEARRLLRSGHLPEAVAGFKQAESSMDDPDFRVRCAEGRAVAALWLPHATGLELGRGAPDRLLRLSRELRLVTRSVRNVDQVETGLARGIRHLLSGNSEEALRVLSSAAADAGVATWELLALRLAGHWTDLASPSEAAASRLEAIMLAADVEGLPWLSKMARGMQLAILVAFRPTSWRVAACAELIADCERQGDQWATCLLAGALGAALALAGQDDVAVRSLRRSEAAARDLDAPVLEVWAAAYRTVIAADRGGLSPTDLDAATTRRRAHGLGVEGAVRLISRAGSAGLAPASTDTETEQTARGPGPAAVASGPPQQIRLGCLGAFELTVDGVDVSWDQLRPRARALLMLMSLHHRRDVHRERLIDALWPEATLASGTRSLQVAMSSVRQCLLAAGMPGDCLRRHGDTYALHLENALDLLSEFERLVQLSRRQEAGGEPREALLSRQSALGLYRGDLLPEVGPADWVVGERDRCRSLAAGAAADASRLAAGLGELPTAVQAAKRSIELDRYRDLSWLLLTEAYERLGDHSAAAVTRREHARMCVELGLPPPPHRQVVRS